LVAQVAIEAVVRKFSYLCTSSDRGFEDECEEFGVRALREGADASSRILRQRDACLPFQIVAAYEDDVNAAARYNRHFDLVVREQGRHRNGEHHVEIALDEACRQRTIAVDPRVDANLRIA